MAAEIPQKSKIIFSVLFIRKTELSVPYRVSRSICVLDHRLCGLRPIEGAYAPSIIYDIMIQSEVESVTAMV